MSGFNNAVVDQAFFPDGRFKSNFLCNIGYGDHSQAVRPEPPARLRGCLLLRLTANSRKSGNSIFRIYG